MFYPIRFGGASLPVTQQFLSVDQNGTATLAREEAEEMAADVPGQDVEAVEAVVEDDSATFASLGLTEELLQSITAVGYEVPSPIQEQVIPSLLAGNDVIAQAQTGSGKTAAFGLPVIEAIDQRRREIQALVLCPTRELAIQVSEALHKYGRHKRVETLPIYGGQPYERQFRGLQRGVHIVVGTPGRVMDHMRRGTLKLDSLKFFILDEADEMLDMGFVDDIEWVLQNAPKQRQTALFSATIPPRIATLSSKYLKDPHRIAVRGKALTVPEVEQSYYDIPRGRKIDALTRILDAEVPTSAMIFCRTKRMVDELGEALMARGYAAETIHGDLSQAQRDRVMRKFRSGQAEILIATDVAARGLDVPDISHVFNFDVPESVETYIHRVGRTGRQGKAGKAITLVNRREIRWIQSAERATKAKIEFKRLPTAMDVNERRREQLKRIMSDAVADEDAFQTYLDPVRELTEEFDAIDLAAAVLKLYAEETGRATNATPENDELSRMSSGPAPRSSSDGPRSHEGGMTRLTFNIGRNYRVRPQDLVGAIANEANIPGRAIGAIDIMDTNTFVDVPEDMAQQVILAMSASSVKGRPVNVEMSGEPAADGARGAGRSGPRSGGGNRRSGGGGYQGNRPGGFSGGQRRDRRGPRRDSY
ncbi:MAG: DEAD/DEAH box helicase [Chloroflexota bacterium]|jgi:ATP-dependent RNA helicase DeaD|nr:DEAD/DEAH box helicase [Chloroflexota bacterium]